MRVELCESWTRAGSNRKVGGGLTEVCLRGQTFKTKNRLSHPETVSSKQLIIHSFLCAQEI